MFRARLAQLALVAGLGLVSGCSACYSFSLGAPGGGGGLFSRLHQTPARTGDCPCPPGPGCGCAASPLGEGPILEGLGGVPGVPCGSGAVTPPFVDAVPPVINAPHLVPAPLSPNVPYVP